MDYTLYTLLNKKNKFNSHPVSIHAEWHEDEIRTVNGTLLHFFSIFGALLCLDVRTT